MSDWELVDKSSRESKIPSYSDWEVAEELPNSMQKPNESLGRAVLKAPFRIGEDLYRGGMKLTKNIPDYWKSAKTEVPGLLNPLNFHPVQRSKQALAGLLELGQGINHAPRAMADYASNRLNIIPNEWAKKVPRANDITGAIEHDLGSPVNPGDKLIRGIARNADALLGGTKAANLLNPMNITNTGIARKVVREQRRQERSHNTLYNNLFRDAERAGINDVPVNNNLINANLDFIRQYKSPKDYRSLENFRDNPTLQNAQGATSDLKGIMRSLDEKSKSSSLTGEERHLYDAADHTVRHIEENMFMHANGTRNDRLANRHRQINTSYRDNVVPYRYNKNIQNYIDRKLTPKELVNSLGHGEFAVKKGMRHPAIKIRNSLPGAFLGTGALGGLGWLYKEMFGNHPPE